jgi:two-component system cell cycle sensor histidine kinase/response regulator CckA
MRPQQTVRSEEIRALFAQGGPVLWANVGVGAVLVGTLWSSAPKSALLGWFGALTVMAAVRVGLLQSYRRANPEASALDVWGRRFVVGSISSGLLWGLAGVLFFDAESALAQSLLTFAIGGMVAAAAGTLACHLPAFVGFLVPALAPLTLRAFMEGDRLHLGLGLLLLAYGLGMQRVARNNHRAFLRAFRLGTENAALIERLERSRVELTETNRTLEQRVSERTAELERRSQELQAAQRLEIAGRLAGGLAHDFNSLLTVVLNNATLMKESQALDEQGQLAAEETLAAAQRGAALIRQLLAFSSRQRTKPSVFDLNELVSQWSGPIQLLLGEGITATIELAPRPVKVRADTAQVEQVLVNLVTNARAAMPAGGTLQVATRLTEAPPEAALGPGNYVELSVGDSGSGMSAAEIARAFEVDLSPELEPRARHLGLSAARAIVEHWEGRVLVESRVGGGTCFRVYLPITSEPLSPVSEKKLKAAPAERGATILVVDDEATLRSVMRRCLVREGFEVLVAADGEKALALAKAHGAGIDLLLTDVMMPGLSGVELARRLMAERPELVVLFVSGYTFDETMPVIDAAQGTAYLPKPFDTKVLTEQVRELLALRPQRVVRDASRGRSELLSPPPAD